VRALATKAAAKVANRKSAAAAAPLLSKDVTTAWYL
jgi:hypothetical protein